ncbi:beta galactosidase jelly roll domain-containing protein [Streptomyces sp. NPDC005925]|uniref:beta galactosidase jelly roll domain-containing protein n=1 Tax=Streptomyces sp. NPDC005925 TaxID=3157172 RepID=UPI0033D6CB8D
MELSRRTFSALAGTTVLGLALSGSALEVPGTRRASRVTTGPAPQPPSADGMRHDIDVDRYSLVVDGRRVVLWSGEFDPFRLPSPSLWRDLLQKMRAHGYNAVSARVPWNVHAFGPHRYDFTGVRDLDLFLRLATEARLYVLLRRGPSVGADVDAGGLPGWLTGRVHGDADPEFRRHVDGWLAAVDRIVVRHEYARGRGTVLPYWITDMVRETRGDGPDAWGGPGYAALRRAHGPTHERRTLLAAFGGGPALHDTRPAFGGTSWGWLPSSGRYSSNDRAALFDEARGATPALAATHQLGHLLRTVPDLARLDRAARVRPSDDRVAVHHLRNPDTGAHLYVLRNDTAEPVSTTLPRTPVEVPVTVPARDAKLIAAGLELAGRTLAYCTAQPMLAGTFGDMDVMVFAGRHRETEQVVVEYPEEPVPTRLDAEAAWVFSRGRLYVTVPLGVGGLCRVRVDGGGFDRPLLLIFADDAASLRLWPCETPSGRVLVYGPALLRKASVRDSAVRLTGDTIAPTGLEVWGPGGTGEVHWNGRPVRTTLSRSQSLVAERLLPGAPRPALPALDGWRRRAENPEADPGFDDGAWPVADKKTSGSTTPVPHGQPVLFADDYGFPYGDVWYRGRFTGAESLGSVSLTYRTGTQGLLMAWLDGRPLGTHRMPVPGRDSPGTWEDTARFEVPWASRTDGPHVLSVLVRPMQHDDDGTAARGLTGVTFHSAGAFAGPAPRVRWRIRGTAGLDPVRGPLNTGGLYGERHGWHLPGAAEHGWTRTALPREERARQGVTWYRTDFRPAVPAGVDASVGLTLGDDRSHAWRAQVFLNGWNLGQYVNDVGPQHTFVLPNGILRTRGDNTLALAVLSDGRTPSGPREVRLTLLGCSAGGVPVALVDSPGR